MKKRFGILLIFLLIVGCSSQENQPIEVKDGDTFIFSGKILELNKDSMLVEVIFGSYFDEVLVKIDTSKDKEVIVNNPEKMTRRQFPDNLQVDDKVIINYSGMSTKSIPPQITSGKFIWKLSDNAPKDFREWKLYNDGKIDCGC